MGRTVKAILIEIEDYKKIAEKLSACLYQEDVEKTIKEHLEYTDFILLKGLVEQRINNLLESEVEDGNVN